MSQESLKLFFVCTREAVTEPQGISEWREDPMKPTRKHLEQHDGPRVTSPPHGGQRRLSPPLGPLPPQDRAHSGCGCETPRPTLHLPSGPRAPPPPPVPWWLPSRSLGTDLDSSLWVLEPHHSPESAPSSPVSTESARGCRGVRAWTGICFLGAKNHLTALISGLLVSLFKPK